MSNLTEHDSAVCQLMQCLVAIETNKTDHLQCKRQLKKFAAWCAQNNQIALPASPEIVVKYFDHLAKKGASDSSVCAFYRALIMVHIAAGLEHPMNDYSVEKAWLDTFAPEKAKNACCLQLQNFDDWCVQKKLTSLPASPGTVLRYVRHLARHETTFSDMHQAMFAIEQAHREAGLESPTRDVQVQKFQESYYERLLTSMAKKMLLVLKKKGDIWAIRDALLISLVYEIGYKASELVALNAGDVTLQDSDSTFKDYFTIRANYPQTDECIYSLIPKSFKLSPAPFLRAWLEASQIGQGALFRRIAKDGTVLEQRLSQRSVKAILRRASKAAGLKTVFTAQELYMLRRGGRTIHVKH